MTHLTIERLMLPIERLMLLINLIAQYEIGNPEVSRTSYVLYLQEASHLAEMLDMGYYATQCLEKLDLPQNIL